MSRCGFHFTHHPPHIYLFYFPNFCEDGNAFVFPVCAACRQRGVLCACCVLPPPFLFSYLYTITHITQPPPGLSKCSPPPPFFSLVWDNGMVLGGWWWVMTSFVAPPPPSPLPPHPPPFFFGPFKNEGKCCKFFFAVTLRIFCERLRNF